MTPEIQQAALEALRQGVVRLKGREDIEMLGILGVKPSYVQDWISSHTGLYFEVSFTYTIGRRQRRTTGLAYRILPPFQEHSDVMIPDALLAYLSAAVVTS